MQVICKMAIYIYTINQTKRFDQMDFKSCQEFKFQN